MTIAPEYVSMYAQCENKACLKSHQFFLISNPDKRCRTDWHSIQAEADLGYNSRSHVGVTIRGK